MNVTFIGMAGAGKSYIGKRFARKYGLEFLDNDDSLHEKHGKPIQEILDELGEERYLDTEVRTLIETTRERDGLVISPGGSVVYRDEAMDHVKDISSIVYLCVPFETVEDRLRALPPRAIIGLGRKSLRELYDERHPLYMVHADVVVDVPGQSAEEIVTAIGDKLGIDSVEAPATV